MATPTPEPRHTADPLAPLLSMEQVAGLLGTNVRHVRRLVQERRIPHRHIGRYVRFHPDDLARWLNEPPQATRWPA